MFVRNIRCYCFVWRFCEVCPSADICGQVSPGQCSRLAAGINTGWSYSQSCRHGDHLPRTSGCVTEVIANSVTQRYMCRVLLFQVQREIVEKSFHFFLFLLHIQELKWMRRTTL